MKFESSNIELDPSYDPERIEGGQEDSVELSLNTASTGILILSTSAPEYTFDLSTNPFAWNAENPKSVDNIAKIIDSTLRQNLDLHNTLIRAIQSGHHAMSREVLIQYITKHGSDYYNTSDETGIFAAEAADDTVNSILGGFHVFKPKCEERPQYLADIWMIFNKDDFENIEYTHPRHGVVARDKWRARNSGVRPRAILVVN